MKIENNHISTRKYILWIVILAFIVRILCMVALQGWEFKTKRDYGYEGGAIGAALAAGQGYSYPPNNPFNSKDVPVPTSWDPPVYPFIIAAVFSTFGIYSSTSAIVLMIFQTITSALSCVLLFIIGRRIFNIWVGLIAALLFAFYPPSIHYAVQKITTANLIVPMLLLIIIQFINLAEVMTIKKSILAGLTFGIAILTEPVIFTLFPFAILWLLFNKRFEFKTIITNIVFIFLSVCSMMAPWQTRNYLVFHNLFFVQSNFSRELFMGNYFKKKHRADERKYMNELDEGQRSELYWKKALDSIVKNPNQIIRRTLFRFVFYWTGTPRYRLSEAKTIEMKQVIVSFFYMFIFTMGVAGLCLTLFRGREVQLLVLPIISLPIPYYLTWFANFRYRFPVETILIVFASYALYRFWKILNGKMSFVTLR